MLTKLLRLLARERTQCGEQRSRRSQGIRTETDICWLIAEVQLVGSEVKELVLDDRAADVAASLKSLIIGSRPAVLNCKGIASDVGLADSVSEKIAFLSIRAALGSGDDDRARSFLVFCLVVLSEHPELIDRALRQRVPLAGVLSD